MPLASRLIDARWTVDGETISLSLATLVCSAGSVTSYREVSRLLAPLKVRAKSIEGSSWVVGRPGSDRLDVLRNGRSRAVPPPAPGTTAPSPTVTGTLPPQPASITKAG